MIAETMLVQTYIQVVTLPCVRTNLISIMYPFLVTAVDVIDIVATVPPDEGLFPYHISYPTYAPFHVAYLPDRSPYLYAYYAYYFSPVYLSCSPRVQPRLSASSSLPFALQFQSQPDYHRTLASLARP